MREIKFRAWDKERMVMYDVDGLLPPWSECWQSKVEVDARRGDTEYFGIYNEGCDTVLMQYTGLKDKNGVEIYEGDILDFGLRYKKEYRNREVKIPEIFYLSGEERERYSRLLDFTKFEVIGNIYENPELLPTTL